MTTDNRKRKEKFDQNTVVANVLLRLLPFFFYYAPACVVPKEHSVVSTFFFQRKIDTDRYTSAMQYALLTPQVAYTDCHNVNTRIEYPNG